MENNDTTDPSFVKGFNHGYLIAQYEPALAEKLSKIQAVSSHVLGIQQGREQYLRDQLREKLPDWLKNNPTKDTGHQPTPTKDREPDKE